VDDVTSPFLFAKIHLRTRARKFQGKATFGIQCGTPFPSFGSSLVRRIHGSFGAMSTRRQATDHRTAECYGYIAKIGGVQGEVLAHWVGDHYKLIRTDDIGKLPAVDKTDSPKVSQMPLKATESKPADAEVTLPKYETDKAIVMANYTALSQAVAANPNDVPQRAKFVHSLLVIGNTPKAWTESVELYRLAPQNVEVVYAIDQSIEGLKKSGIFQVGVPEDTIESLMGKPLKTNIVDGVTRWEYPNWNVDFNDGRFVKLARHRKRLQRPQPIVSRCRALAAGRSRWSR